MVNADNFHKNEAMIKCTEIIDKKKLKKQLEKKYNDPRIIYMTHGIPITKKTTANKLLKNVFHTNPDEPWDGKCVIINNKMQKIIIDGVNKIAMKCINDEKQRVIKESRTMEYYNAQSQRIKQASYDNPDPMSSDSETDDSLDGFIVGDDVYD